MTLHGGLDPRRGPSETAACNGYPAFPNTRFGSHSVIAGQ